MSVWPTPEDGPAEAQPEPPCKTGSQCVGGKCERCVEPEPVAWMDENDVLWNEVSNPKNYTALYTEPPKREWVVLTDEEVKSAWSELWYDLNNGKFAASDDTSRHTTVMFARAIEAKLKEKNV
jgi:hypothetical protein